VFTVDKYVTNPAGNVFFTPTDIFTTHALFSFPLHFFLVCIHLHKNRRLGGRQ